MVAALLGQTLPVDAGPGPETLRRHTFKGTDCGAGRDLLGWAREAIRFVQLAAAPRGQKPGDHIGRVDLKMRGTPTAQRSPRALRPARNGALAP